MDHKNFTILLPDRSLVNSIWTKSKSTSGRDIWSAEASTLDANKDRRPRNQCPKCDCFFQKKDMLGVQTTGWGDDEEIGFWHFICPNCRSNIQIFND